MRPAALVPKAAQARPGLRPVLPPPALVPEPLGGALALEPPAAFGDALVPKAAQARPGLRAGPDEAGGD